MKLLITFLLLCGAAFGQTTNVNIPYLDKVAIFPKPSTFTFPAVIFRSTAAEGLPLVIAAHGTGEAGTGGTKLWNAGLPYVLKNGFRPPYDVVIVCPQHTSYSIYPEHLPRIIQDMYERFKIDTNKVYLTGFSAGGFPSYGSQFNVTEVFSKKIAAIVPISAATQDINKTRFAWASAPIWAIVGNNDVSYRDQNIDMVAKINAAKPGLAKITIRSGIGHSGWNEIYNATWKDNGVSIWDFLKDKTIAPVVVVPPPVPPAPTKVTLYTFEGCGQRITLYVNGTDSTWSQIKL
jgi:predicted peptidase